MHKLYALSIIVLLLHGCSSLPRDKTLLDATAKRLQQDHKLEHATLIISYNLAQLSKNKCIYAKDFGLIINDIKYNKTFLQKFSPSCAENINNQAIIKSVKIKDLLRKLHCKYQFLSKKELQLVQKSNTKEGNNINELFLLDKIITAIPIMLPQYNVKVTSHYGMRKHPRKRQAKFHCGMDLKSYKASPIYASADGRITLVLRKKGYGNLIEIKHSNKFTSRYAHLKKMYVKKGDNVIRGQIIGLQGNSGNSTGEHLHFEIWLNNNHVNPFDFISHACNY